MRKLCFLSFAILTTLLSVARGPLGMAPQPPKGPQVKMRAHSRSDQSRVISQPGFFLENFEDCPGSPDFTFPDGWLTRPNPSDSEDLWRVGTITKEGSPMNGASGTKYAFVLGTGKTHDAWAVSPAIEMQSGQNYDISLYAVMFSGDSYEGFEVVVLPAQNIAATPVARFTVTSDEDNDGNWIRFKETFTPTATGNYYIGIHSNAGGGLNYGTVIDDLKVTHGEYPVFNGDTFLQIGDKGSLDARVDASYEFYNMGEAGLNVGFQSLTDGLEVLTPEVVVEPSEWGEAKFRLTSAAVGPFEGYVKVTTNDPSAADFTMKVTATVKQSRMTGYNHEDFENGGPEGWELCLGSVNTADYGGHNGSSRAFYTTSYYTMLGENPDGVGFTTHYVEMGSEPVFKFWYRLFNSNFFGDPSGPTGADVPRIRVLATSDYGVTWDEVHLIEPGGAHEHKPVDDYQEVSLSLPQLSGKTCRFKVLFTHASGDVMDAMMNTFTILVDDVTMGTPIPQDAKTGYLKGATTVTPGVASTYTVSIANAGTEMLPAATVTLVDAVTGNSLKSSSVENLAAGSSQEVTFDWSASEAGTFKLRAEVTADNDVIPDNNVSNSIYIAALPSDNSIVTINHGQGMQSQGLPINFYGVETEVQTIIYANEIGMTRGTIGSLTVSPRMNGDFYSESFEVYLAETNREDYADSRFEPISGMTKVFEGRALFPDGATEFVIPFDRPFEYHGGNLILCTRKLGNELINSKWFTVHKCDAVRTVYASGIDAGSLEEQKSKHPSAVYAYPEVKINRVMAPSGSVSGKVSDSKGAVAGARVTVAGTRMHALTDETGQYTLSGVAAGANKLDVTCHGYYDNAGNSVKVMASSQVGKDLTLTLLPRYSVTGVVKSAANGNPVEGARVDLRGYDDFVSYTGADGRYEISGVCGEEGFDYDLRVSDGYFDAFAKKISVSSNVTTDASLRERVLPASGVTASQEAGEIEVSWGQPLPEVRHDSGLRDGCLGYPGGWREVIMGMALRERMMLEEVRFFVTDEESGHANFNVIILGLKPDGTPDGNNVIYEDYGIDYVDNDWTTYRLREPLEVDGCLVAISCTGFLGIGMTPSSPEYPLEDGMYYYAGESYRMEMGIWDMTHTSFNSTLMIRACGYRLGDDGNPVVSPRTPSAGYKVLRLPYGEEDPANWTSVGAANETFLTDSTPFEDGRYRYAVVASYKSGDADPALSPVINLTHDGIESVTEDAGIRVEGNTIIAPDGAGIFTLSGIRVDGINLAPGIYLVNDRGTTVKAVIR